MASINMSNDNRVEFSDRWDQSCDNVRNMAQIYRPSAAATVDEIQQFQ